MANSEWIHVRERMPREDECGPNRRIIVWHRYNGAMIANTHQLAENQFMEWWIPYPKAPEGMEHTMMDELKAPRHRL